MTKLVYYYDLITHLVKRQFYLQYKRSYLGILWSLIVPFSQLIILNLVFTSILPLGIQGYGAFVFCALLPWNWFSNSISNSGHLYYANKDLLKKPNFRPFMLNIVDIGTNLLLFLVALPVLLLILVYYDRALNLSILFLPVLIAAEFILIFAISLLVSVLNVIYTDIQHIVSVLLTLLFYLCPIFYGIDALGEKSMFLYKLNPFASLVESYRMIFFDGKLPDLLTVLYVVLCGLVLTFVSYYIYQREVDKLVDRL